MPHPGLKVATSPTFEGQLAGMQLHYYVIPMFQLVDVTSTQVGKDGFYIVYIVLYLAFIIVGERIYIRCVVTAI
jgi:hypothetical protein